MTTTKTLTSLKWYDFLILTLLLFGWFIYKSSAYAFGWIATSDTGTASTSYNYLPNLILQSALLFAAIVYLMLRRFDFKQIPIRFDWRVPLWGFALFFALGLVFDGVNSLLGPYNYFGAEMWRYFDWSFVGVLQKFATLPLIMVLYSILNGIYEEFFFLGLLGNAKQAHPFIAVFFSTLIRISFHTYQGWQAALITGIGVGLLFYVLYRFKIKNLAPFFFLLLS